jgi:surface antigen
MLRPEEARAIHNKLAGLNQRQYDLFKKLDDCIQAVNSDWNGEIAVAVKDRLSRTKTISTTITEEMNAYTSALEFAIRELEEADLKASTGKRIADVNNYRSGTTSDGVYHGKKGECVWYVRNRAAEKGLDTYGITGDGNRWWPNAIAKVVPTGTDIRDNSIACFSGPKPEYGHVLFVERVISGRDYYTEANVDGGIGDSMVSPGDGVLKSVTTEEFGKLYKGSLQGYIYL